MYQMRSAAVSGEYGWNNRPTPVRTGAGEGTVGGHERASSGLEAPEGGAMPDARTAHPVAVATYDAAVRRTAVQRAH